MGAGAQWREMDRISRFNGVFGGVLAFLCALGEGEGLLTSLFGEAG